MNRRFHSAGFHRLRSHPVRVYGGLLFGGTLLLVAVLSSLLGTACGAPPSNLRFSEYQKQDWQVEDGLPDNNVRMIVQRPDGELLLATSSGISSFDGQRFQNLPKESTGIIDNEAINAVLPEGNVNLWIGTDGRGVLYHTQSGTTNISEEAGLFNERVRLIYPDASGALWIATQNGVERYANKHLEVLAGVGMISGDITTPFAEDGHGGMFFVTSSGLFYWRNGSMARYALHLPAGDAPVAVYRDLQQRIWIGTMKSVVQLVPRKLASRKAVVQYDEVDRGAVGGPVTVLLSDTAGDLWIGTRREGLWRLASDGLSQWSSRNGLTDDCIRSLFMDDENNLWVGMLAGGLSRWHKGALAPYANPELFHYAANVFADSRGDLWLGTWGKGLFRWHNGQLASINPPTMPITTPIRALAEDLKKQIWIGTWFDGIYRYDGKAFYHYLLGTESPGNAVSSILPDKQGRLWVGTYTGLFYFPSGLPDFTQRVHFLESQLVTCLVEDEDGSILVGTSTGLYRVRDGNASTVSELARSYILSLTRDSRGTVWVSTKGGGLSAVHSGHVVAIPASSGLPGMPINTVVEDGDGHLWLGTTRGIVRVGVAELHAVLDGNKNKLSVVILGSADGMRSSEIGGPSKPTSTRLPDGTLWFATMRGFVHTTDLAEHLSATNPSATITSWTMSNDASAADIVNATPSSHIDLEPGQPDMLVFFNAKLLSNPAHLEFRYRLTGYDAEWTTTRSRVARYRRLPPGNYHFEVQARGSGEGWTSPIASIPIKQHPYLYQTWYFYVALLLVAAAIAVQLFRRRVQLIKGRIGIVLEERNRIARECHDTLMAGFAAISWQLEATAKHFRDDGSESTAAANSCELARSMVAHCQAEARRIIWDLRDTDEVTNLLSQAICRTLANNHPPKHIETTLDIEGAEIPLTPVCLHHLLCIGQEAISNSVRHANPDHIMICLKYEEDALVLSIRDDGRGFHGTDRSYVRSGHFGIPVMEERARKIGGTFRLQSISGQGTEVIVRVSFNAMLPPTQQEQNVIQWIGI